MKKWSELTGEQQNQILKLYPHLDTNHRLLRVIFNAKGGWVCFHIKGR